MQTWHKFIHLCLTLVLSLGLLGATAAPQGKALGRVQPLLLRIAAEQPEQQVSVIVQKTTAGQALEDFVAQTGGTVIQALPLIHAFAAELPAQAALALAEVDGVRWISLDAAVVRSSADDEAAMPYKALLPIIANDEQGESVSAAALTNPPSYYLDTISVRQVWTQGLRGQGVGVAVIDSGVTATNDFNKSTQAAASRLKQFSFNPKTSNVSDTFGHGTHVAGIIGGNGAASGGFYSGVAPQVNLYGLKISDDQNLARESDAIAAMQWVYDHKTQYNIRAINLSINSTVEQSYQTSPLDAAAEILWFNGVVVVVSAGNAVSHGVYYKTVDAAPANDPFVITVGASNQMLNSDPANDFVALYSAYGVTMDGFVKPDIVAPGTAIISVLAPTSNWATQYPLHVVANGAYFWLSGTSMAAPMVTGAVALLLQDEPTLTPDQVKYRLTHASNTIAGTLGDKRTYPYLNVYKAVSGVTTQSANTGIAASRLLWTGSNPLAWNSVNWNSVNWNSVNWNSVNWNSVNWNSVNWNSISWDN
ncbi:MAG: S8 family peptidase [Caldilineaceae bacterium]